MGCSSGPDVVEDGLVFCLDAASKRSYSGSGTTWVDVVRGNNGTLTNGPVFNSGNGGYFSFDGTNDDCLMPTKLVYDTGYDNIARVAATWFPELRTDFHVDFVCRPYSSITIRSESSGGLGGTSGQKYLFGNLFSPDAVSSGAGICISLAQNAIQIFAHAANHMPCLLSYEGNFNTITHFAINFINNQPSVFVNGDLKRSRSVNTRVATFNMNAVGSNTQYYGGVNADIYCVRLYNKSFTTDEIRRNYLSTKERYQ